MIIPILHGGLGNQMFQIANAFAYSLRHNCDWGINYHLCSCPNQGYIASKYKNNFYSKIPAVEVNPNIVYKEPFFRYIPIPYFKNILFDGYFQSEKYFEDFSNEVRNIFVFPNEIKNKVDKFLESMNKPKVGIHIRRGDYIRISEIFNIKKADYYIQSSKIIGNGYQSIICTDD